MLSYVIYNNNIQWAKRTFFQLCCSQYCDVMPCDTSEFDSIGEYWRSSCAFANYIKVSPPQDRSTSTGIT